MLIVSKSEFTRSSVLHACLFVYLLSVGGIVQCMLGMEADVGG